MLYSKKYHKIISNVIPLPVQAMCPPNFKGHCWELRDPLGVMLLFTVSVVFSCSCQQVHLHKASLVASAKHNAYSVSTCCVGKVESPGFY